MNNIETVLFDLDGTLIDTAPDLAAALNDVLQEQQREPLPFEKIRPVVSHGAGAMVKLGFQIDDDHTDFIPLRNRLVDIYADNIAIHSRLFTGMEEVLQVLEEKGIKWGIVTNKMGALTDALLAQLKLDKRSVCNISGDTLPRKKPHPDPLFHACNIAQTDPKHCIYVGDAARDVEAGQRAGMRTLVALYGYIGIEDAPETWGATGMLNTPLELLDWFK